MMTAVRAYYDGKNFVPLQEYDFKPQQQVLIVVDDIASIKVYEETPAEKFLNLSWYGDENADDLLSSIENNRVNSSRFGAENELFD